MSEVRRELAHTVTVVDRRPLADTALLLRLRIIPRGVTGQVRPRATRTEFGWLPGQYIELAAPTAPDASLYYSIASAPDPTFPGEFELAMSLSAGPALLTELEPGRTLLVSEARGSFVWEAVEGSTLLVGIGTGVAPLRAMLQAALRQSEQPVTLLLGARTERTLLFGDELHALSKRDARFRFEPVLSRESADYPGSRGRVQEHVARILKEGHPARVYVCGTTAMVRDTVSLLHELGVPALNVRAESHGD